MEIKARKLTGWIEMTIGLMGKEKPEAVFFTTRFGIHTFFMRFPIDVVILDKRNKVKSLKKGLAPYRIFLWKFAYNKVLELPSGTINRLRIKKEEQLTIIFV